jgi:threonine synthase
MKYYSTNNKSHVVDFKAAVIEGLPPDNGLYMPSHISKIEKPILENISSHSLQDLAYIIARKFIAEEEISTTDLKNIIKIAINFPAPVVRLDENISVLELFHGPSLAFKDFGARFMAQTILYFNRSSKPLNILVATSGDTGGAVASGFYDVPGINVIILYPSGKVSDIQEKQLTTLGKNIIAFEVNGDFDDCQAMVKKAFLDEDLKKEVRISSANSINIARLIPQIFYYFESFKQLNTSKDVVYAVPSGNFGNLTAGLFAKKLGLPISKFIAATNINDVIPRYLTTGQYEERPTFATISNAMDVSSPSNFKRILNLYSSTWNTIRGEIVGASFTDDQTVQGLKDIYAKYNYVADPHGAIGYLSCVENLNKDEQFVFLETAHPIKFADTIKDALGIDIPLPDSILNNNEKKSIYIQSDYLYLKNYLIKNCT